MLLSCFFMRGRIFVSDVNGSKGGVDKRCIVSARLLSPGEITIISERMDYLEAFQASLARLVRSVQRESKRQRQKPIRINRRVKFAELKKENLIANYGKFISFARIMLFVMLASASENCLPETLMK